VIGGQEATRQCGACRRARSISRSLKTMSGRVPPEENERVGTNSRGVKHVRSRSLSRQSIKARYFRTAGLRGFQFWILIRLFVVQLQKAVSQFSGACIQIKYMQPRANFGCQPRSSLKCRAPNHSRPNIERKSEFIRSRISIMVGVGNVHDALRAFQRRRRNLH